MPTEKAPITEAAASDLDSDSALPTQENWQRYQNTEYRFALDYPPSWVVVDDNALYVTISPPGQEDWKPEKPADSAQDPRIRIELGGYVREKAGPKNFPDPVTSDTIRDWLQDKANRGEAEQTVSKQIGSVQAYQLEEIGLAGCQQIVYWRPDSIEQLLRLSTGCASDYLPQFETVCQSIRETAE